MGILSPNTGECFILRIPSGREYSDGPAALWFALAISNAIAAACMAAAGLLAVLAILVALPVLVVEVVPWHWEAALVWTLAYLVIAGGLYLFGKSRLRLRLPAKTLDSLKETEELAFRHMRSTSR